MRPEDLAERASVPLSSIRSQIDGGRLRLEGGVIPRSDCIRYLQELGQAIVDDPPAAPEPVTAEPAEFDPEDPNWIPGCDATRISWVCDQLARVVAPRVIIRELMAKGLSRSRAEVYLRRAYDDLSVLGSIGSENRRDQYRDTLAEILHECMEEVWTYGREGNALEPGPRDLRTAARIVDQLIKLDGGYPAQKIRVDGQVETVSGQAAPDSIRARIAAYMADPVLMAKVRGEESPPSAPEPTPDLAVSGDVAG